MAARNGRPGWIRRALTRLGFGDGRAQARAFWAGASINRLNADWIMGPVSADQAVKADLRALRDRARQLLRDNPWAARYGTLQRDGIIGPDGVALQVRVPGRDAWAKEIETKFAEWGRPTTCSANGRLSWIQIQQLAATTWTGEGEFLALILPTPGNPFGMSLQVLDADQLDEKLNVPASEGENEIRMGVELDAFGRAVAYHIWTAHPSDNFAPARQRRRVSAQYVIHLYDALRPGQTRGITRLAPVMQKLRMVDGLEEALLVLQRTAACKMGFILNDPDKAAVALQDEENPQGPVTWDAEPGRIEQLGAGQTFAQWDPGQPTAEYDAFSRSALRSVAAGLGLSYASLSGDLSQANYGSNRVGMTTERDGFERDQQYIIPHLHERVFAAWFESALLTGALELPPNVRSAAEIAWEPRGFPWIDPEKDINAALTEVRAGVNTLTNIAAKKGRNFAELVRQRAEEERVAREAGVTLDLGAKPALSAPEPTPQPGETDGEQPPARALVAV